jgi:ABC-type transport system substrate-binding protein
MDSERLLDFVPPDKPYKRFFSSPELETTIKNASQEFDTAKRKTLLEQANQQFFDLAPVAFLYQGIGLHGMAKNVQGFKVTPDTIMHLGSVSLA